MKTQLTKQTMAFRQPGQDNTPDRLFTTIPVDQIDGMGATIITVDVVRPDGKTARFLLSLRIPGDPRGGMEGECYASIATFRGQKAARDVRKEVRASWIDFDARLNAIRGERQKGEAK